MAIDLPDLAGDLRGALTLFGSRGLYAYEGADGEK
jgi:hypothetical protein